MRAIRLQTEYLTEPLGLGIRRPEFSWNCQGGTLQSAYRVVARKGNPSDPESREGEILWDSGKVESSSMTHIPYGGAPLGSRERVNWTVTLWDEKGEQGEEAPSWFETGLLFPSDWEASWISGDYKPRKNTRYPADCFRKRFKEEGKIVSARLYATARGVYRFKINGKPLEDFILAPGMTDYRKRIQYQTYDVTGLLKEKNTIEAMLFDGWFRGSAAAYGVTNVFGDQTSLMAQLEIAFEDGSCRRICTDSSWSWSGDGPVRFADLRDGEVYDASMEPSYGGRAREVQPPEGVRIAASDNVPVREHERFPAKLLPGRVLDFGQNIAGYLSFDIKGRKGEAFRIVCGEVLDKNGNVDLSGVQEERPVKGWNGLSLIRKLMTGKTPGVTEPTPRQEILFTCSGGQDHYKTSAAVFGFRYAQVFGGAEIHPEDFTAIAVYSDMEETGTFACSSDLVNQLVSNTRWSMKGNFLDVPTDCPTRERLGWTGDAQIFFDTGAYLMNTAPFFRKWLRDMEDNVYPNGLISAVIPYSGVEMMYKATGSSVGWADAVYLIPWRHYLRYGDKRILEASWPMIRGYGDYLLKNLGQRDKKEGGNNPLNEFTYEKGVHLGEWLEPEEFRDTVYGTKAKHPEECTAYLYYSMTTMGKIADLLEEPHEAYDRAAEGAKMAYLRFADLDTDRQAKLVRPLALGLLEGNTKKRAQERLKKAAENYHYRVGTGFLSTPFILPVLTEAGETETAYRMLENTEKPGWLAEILEGATTIWENWEGDLSRNHYSPGAVCQWLFDTCAGIRVEGERHFVISPVPGGSLTFAEASYLSPYGRVESRWEKKEGKILYQIRIPENCSAEIRLPGMESINVTAGRYLYEQTL